jgi:catecholate siderophore receptor
MTSARDFANFSHFHSLGAEVSEGSLAAEGRKDRSPVKLMTAFAVLAASPATVAQAQQAAEPADELPPLVVETSAKKKKQAAAAKKKAAPTSPVPQAPSAEPVAERPRTPPLPGQAGPVAPGQYNAEYSTSNKITGPLLDTPQTVTVIPGTIISERGATNLTQALRNTPGITFDAGENGFATSTNNFKLRGFDTSGSIFVDGVRNSGSFARDMFNVEQVEVFKGAAADNGRGGAAGYVNIITKTPQDENFVRGEASLTFDDYGTDPLFRSTIDVNQRVGTVAVRMNGMFEDGGVMGRDVAEAEAYGLAPSIAFGLGTDTRAIFSYERLQRNDLPDWGVPGAMVKGTFRYDPVAGRASRDNFYGLNSDFDDVEGDRVMARFEHDISPNFTISNQTVWDRGERFSRFTIPTGFSNPNVTSSLQYYDRVNETWSNQTNLSGRFSTGAFHHTISTGIEYTNETSDANRFTGAAAPGSTNIFNPNPDRAHPGPLAPAQVSTVEIDTIAGYLYDTIALSRQWELVGGVRVEHYNVEIDSKTAAGASNGVFDGFDFSDTTVGGKIGLVYKPADNGTLYASYGISGLPPGSYLSNPDISRTSDQSFPGFVTDPKTITIQNYEIGVKWDWLGGKLSTTAAAFYTEKQDVARGTATNFAFGDEAVQGIELGIAGNLTERWKVFGGLLVLDSELKHGKDVDAVASTQGISGSDPLGDYNGATTTNGDEIAFTPNFSATLWTTYDVTDKLTLGGGVQYVGESWLGRPDDALRIVKNGKYGKLPDYFLVNFMASYDLTDDVDLQFNIDNVFDEDYAVSTNWNGTRATLGAPRTYRIGTSFDF